DVPRHAPAAEQARDLFGAPTGLLAGLDVRVAALRELLGPAPQERIQHRRAAERGRLDRVGTRAHDVDRRMRPLERLGDHADLGDRVVAGPPPRRPLGSPPLAECPGPPPRPPDFPLGVRLGPRTLTAQSLRPTPR